MLLEAQDRTLWDQLLIDRGLAALARADALGPSHLLPAVRGDLLASAGRKVEAAEAFRLAAGRTRNAGERAVLLDRAEPS